MVEQHNSTGKEKSLNHLITLLKIRGTQEAGQKAKGHMSNPPHFTDRGRSAYHLNRTMDSPSNNTKYAEKGHIPGHGAALSTLTVT